MENVPEELESAWNKAAEGDDFTDRRVHKDTADWLAYINLRSEAESFRHAHPGVGRFEQQLKQLGTVTE